MKARKTILITAPYFPPAGGGLERYALQVARLLDRDYHWRLVVICSSDNWKKDYREDMGGIIVYRLSRDARLSNTPLGLNWPRKIKKIIENEKPDIINVHTPVPGLGDIVSYVGRDIPQVITYHTGSMRKGSYLDLFILSYEKILLPFMLRRAKSIICSSDFVRENFLKEYSDKSETITPGVDAGFFSPHSEERSQDHTVLFVAKLDEGQEYKGLKDQLDATKLLREEFSDIRLVVAGDGNLKNEYENYAARINIQANVEFRGRLDGRELLTAYRGADIFSLPTSNDSQPLAVLEAMAAGLPVVSTRVGGIPSMVENGKEGVLINPHDPQILADKIAELLRDPQLRKSFSEAARERAVKDFSWQGRIERYSNILEKAMRDHEKSHVNDKAFLR